MGIINKDSYQNRYGQELTNTYISLGNNTVELKKEVFFSPDGTTERYVLTGIFNIWLSKESRNNDKSSFTSHIVHKVLSSDEITTNLYNILYTEIKNKYTNTTDDL